MIPADVEPRAVPGYCADESCACHAPRPVVGADPWRDQRGLNGAPGICCTRCGRRGPKPLTIVSPNMEVTLDEMAERVRASMREHGTLLQEYHRIWYESGHTWPYTHFLGVGMMKCPNDLWIYQDLMATHRPKTVLETGTYTGASALWFAFLMDALAIEGGRVVTIDIDDHRRCSHPRVTHLGGSSVDPALAAAAMELVEGPLLVSLDADHSAEHVYRELCLYAPACRVGDWLVVEDTNISWPGEHGDGGAQGGVTRYLREHEGEFMQDILCERYLLSMNPGGWLRRVAECAH